MGDLPDKVTATVRAEDAQVRMSGSGEDNCLECGETVVVSPSTRTAIDAGIAPDYIVCIVCIMENKDE